MPALHKCKIRLLKILNVELLFYQDTKNWYHKGKERCMYITTKNLHRAKEIQASASHSTHTHTCKHRKQRHKWQIEKHLI